MILLYSPPPPLDNTSVLNTVTDLLTMSQRHRDLTFYQKVQHLISLELLIDPDGGEYLF